MKKWSFAAVVASVLLASLAPTTPNAQAKTTPQRWFELVGIARNGGKGNIFADIYDAAGHYWGAIGGGTSYIKLPDNKSYEIFATVSRTGAGGVTIENTIMYATVHLSAKHNQVRLDARRGKLIDVAVADPSATGSMRVGLEHHGIYFSTDGTPGRVFAVPTSKVSRLVFHQGSTWVKKGAAQTPYIYRLGSAVTGDIPNGVRQHVSGSSLGSVQVTYRGFGPNLTANPTCSGGFWAGDSNVWLNLPATVTEYLTPGQACTRRLWYQSTQGNAAPTFGDLELGTHSYRAGVAAPETYGTAAFGPASPGGAANRNGYALSFTPPAMYADGAGHPGFDQFGNVTVKLSRGATVLPLDAYDPTVNLPKASATYRLDLTTSRAAPSVALSSQTSLTWLFKSGWTTRSTRLPLSVVRLTPQGLDDANTAALGSSTNVGVAVLPNPGAPGGTPTVSSVWFSTDGGSNWQPLTVTNGSVTVPDPGTARYVSLRVTAADPAGDSVQETILDAYQVG